MTDTQPSSVESPLTFRVRHRLAHARQFAHVFNGKCRKVRGPLTVITAPNGLAHPRLGLSIGARIGSAVVRNRLKRLIREAFRLEQHALPIWMDFPREMTVDAAPRQRARAELAAEQGGEDVIACPVRAGSYDIIVTARAHTPLPLTQYRRFLVELAQECAAEWTKRANRREVAPRTGEPSARPFGGGAPS